MPQESDVESTLSFLMRATAPLLRAEFERSRAIRHRGEEGTAREKILVANLLADCLPGKVKINSSCKIVDSRGFESPQVDIAVYEPAAPSIYRHADFRIFPSECVYGTIEVKSKLNKQEIIKSMEAARKIKQLSKTEYEWDLSNTSREYNDRTWHHCHTVSYLFAYDSIDLRTLAEYMTSYYAEHLTPGEERLDGIWVLGKGTLCWASLESNTIRPFPADQDLLCALEVHSTQDVLLNMIVLLNSHFSTVWMPPFRLNKYAGKGTIGKQLGVYRVPMDGSFKSGQTNRVE